MLSSTHHDSLTRRFFDQIQGQMAIADMPWCDLMCWIPKNSKKRNFSILRIQRNETYWESRLEPELRRFCAELKKAAR